MKLADNSLKTVRDFFFSELEPIWGTEVNSLFFIWWNEKKGWTRSEIQLNIDQRLSESEILDFLRAIKRLKKGEPIQYIMGWVPFLDCKVLVDTGVLIPRPETEEIVFKTIDLLKNRSQPNILDLCTGSGCIALALKKKIPNSTVFAVDVSEISLELAMKSAKWNELEIQFINDDVLNPEIKNLPLFDLIISNPPYVLEKEKIGMEKHVLDFEPHLALFVQDDDPLLFYRKIISNYSHQLKTGGYLIFEINEAFADLTVDLLKNSGEFSDIRIHSDLQGKERMIECVKKSE